MRPHARFAGLDGLRAIAVALVVVYHLFPGGWLKSGFIGVDVFFVISGFLITSLLLRERAATGRIALVAFWRRRARRLLPALALLVTATATWAWFVGGDVLVRLGRQVLGAGTFSYNWVSAAGGADYFSADTPELLRNLWSLAVEEQFYVVWPLVLPLLLLVPRRWARAMVALVLAGASAAWMATVVSSGAGSATRAYFGTDTHAFGLLLGVALAVGLQRVLSDAPAWMLRRRTRWTGGIVGVAAVAALFAIALLPEMPDAATFPGTLLAGSIVAAVAVVAGAVPGSWIGRALDVPPLRWIGDRSYGLYLWHWPVLVLVAAGVGVNAGADDVPVWIGLVVLVLTVLLAALSYRFVEQPVRRLGLRGSLRRLGGYLGGHSAAARTKALGMVLAGALVLAGTTAAIAAAPAESSGQLVVAAGRRALADNAAPRPPLLPEGAPADARQADGAGDAPATLRAVVDGRQIDAIGDSVMLASAPALMARYPGIHIDAKVSRSMWVAPGMLRKLADRGALREYVVLGLGTNGAIAPHLLDEVMAAIGPQRRLVLVTAFAPRSWIAGVNKTLTAFAEGHPHAHIADWSAAIRPHENLLAGDHIHPGEAGGRIFASVVADAIAALQLAQAQQRERMMLRAAQLGAELPADAAAA
ncbi:acyltransferase family protein [Microbacterium kribbense]|uniref:Acyltransferase family protein n=1 Tax=Microbacterium kribbense TaxID=433645 RepID=A0ABP7GE38_9MICO